MHFSDPGETVPERARLVSSGQGHNARTAMLIRAESLCYGKLLTRKVLEEDVAVLQVTQLGLVVLRGEAGTVVVVVVPRRV